MIILLMSLRLATFTSNLVTLRQMQITAPIQFSAGSNIKNLFDLLQ